LKKEPVFLSPHSPGQQHANLFLGQVVNLDSPPADVSQVTQQSCDLVACLMHWDCNHGMFFFHFTKSVFNKDAEDQSDENYKHYECGNILY